MNSTSTNDAFAVWLTGLPSSGKSTIAAELAGMLESSGVRVTVLESDRLREVLTPGATYDEGDREQFYRQVVLIASLVVSSGVSTIIDATANRRSYRDSARRQIKRFFEVYVDTPLEICIARDPKGIYRGALEGRNGNVPGLRVPYEAPENPEIVVHGAEEEPREAAARIIEKLRAFQVMEKNVQVKE